MAWALIQSDEHDRTRGIHVVGRIYPATLTRADDALPICIPNTSVAPAALVVEEPGVGLFIEPDADGPLTNIAPGPHHFLKDVNAAVAAHTGEICRTAVAA